MKSEPVNEMLGYKIPFLELPLNEKKRLAFFTISAVLLCIILLTNFISSEILKCVVIVYGQAMIACASLQRRSLLFGI